MDLDLPDPEVGPLDLHLTLEVVGLGAVPAGADHGHAALEAEAAGRGPADAGLGLGGARHVQVHHAPGAEGVGHLVRSDLGPAFGVDQGQAASAQGGAAGALGLEARQVQAEVLEG